MTETFTDVCKILLGNPDRPQIKTNKPYNASEVNYLLLWYRLEKISEDKLEHIENRKISKDDTHFTNSDWIKDLYSVIDTRSYLRTINIFDLAVHPLKHICISHISKPKFFDGYLSVGEAKIRLKTHNSSINLHVVDSKYRYSLEKPKTVFKIDTRQLKGFGSISENSVKIKYRRTFDELMLQSVYPSDVLFFLNTLDVTPEALINIRIDSFLKGSICSNGVLSALVYFSKIQKILNVELSRLIPRLETDMTTCTGDSWSYELYKYIGFLVKIGKTKLGVLNNTKQSYRIRKSTTKVRESMFDPQFNSVIMQSSEIPSSLFNRLSSRILVHISEMKREKESISRAYQAFRFYFKLGIPLNSIFIHKFFLINSPDRPALSNLLEMGLFGRCTREHDGQKSLSRLLRLFPINLSETLKLNGDVNELYQYLFGAIRLLKIPKGMICALFDEINHVHKKRILRAIDIGDLRKIHGSMITCEKSLGLTSEKIEEILKKRAGMLVKK